MFAPAYCGFAESCLSLPISSSDWIPSEVDLSLTVKVRR